MADGTMINGEFYDDRAVEIAGDDLSKISGLTQMVSDLEQENDKIARENKEHRQRIEELEDSVKELSDENVGLKKQINKAESENKTLGAVAARAAELEVEVSRLQHDFVSTLSDLQESTVELSNLKRDMTEMKEREKEKDVKLEAIEKERNFLVSKVENLEGVASSIRDELEGKEREIRGLKMKVEELEAMVGSSKTLEKLKNDLEKTVGKMKVEISVLESSLDEKEKVISGFEMKEREVVGVVNGGISGDIADGGGKKGFIGDLKQKDWVVVAGSTFAAVAVMSVACYIKHAARKQ